MIREDQYQRVTSSGLNFSGLVRDLLDDHTSEHKVTLSMSEETTRLYQTVISRFGADDRTIEPFFVAALDRFLEAGVMRNFNVGVASTDMGEHGTILSL